MQVSVEISMYPLREDYLVAIDDFLERLHSYKDLRVETNSLSTQVFGPISSVFKTLEVEIQRSYENFGQCSFVMKVLNSDLSGTVIKPYGQA